LKLEALRKDLNTGINSLNAGKGQPFDKKSIKAKAQAMLDHS